MIHLLAILALAAERTVIPDRLVWVEHEPITGVYQGMTDLDDAPVADWPTFEWIEGAWLFGNSASYFVPTDPLEDVAGMVAEPGTHTLVGDAPRIRIVASDARRLVASPLTLPLLALALGAPVDPVVIPDRLVWRPFDDITGEVVARSV
ncbi:MAG: hypothetical protein KDA28_09320, partial [Phycisphaerales bacterium]|nr:hypothetical protein [Phycisphaerales bacterium]